MSKHTSDREQSSRAEVSDAEEADWRQIIDRFAEGETEEGVTELALVRLQLEKQREELGSLIGQALRLEEEEIGVRAAALAALARVRELEASEREMQARVEKAELSMVVSREEVAALEDRLKLAQETNKRLQEKQASLDARVKESEERAAKAKASERLANDQLNETLESLTELGLGKAELERTIADLKRGFEAVSEERAAAEERWNASDEQKALQIRELKKRVEELEGGVQSLEKERAELLSAREQERETLEAAWKEATAQREALAAVRADARTKIEVLERQQEEFIAKLVDEYDEKLEEAGRELQRARDTSAIELELDKASRARDEVARALDEANAELVRTREAATRLAEVECELSELRASVEGESQMEKERDALRGDVARLQDELKDARAAIDQLLTDCDRLNAENIRLQQPVAKGSEAPGAPAGIPLDPPEDSAGHEAMELAAARTSLPDVDELSQRLAETRDDRDRALAQLREAEQKELASQRAIARLEAELETATQALEDLQAKLDERESTRHATTPGALVSARQSEGRRPGAKKRASQVKRSARAPERKNRAASEPRVERKPPSEAPPRSEVKPDATGDDDGRRAGSYSLIGGTTETIGGTRRKT